MLKRFSFWLRGLIIFQLLTAVFHSLSFFIKPEPKDEEQKHFQDLLYGYKEDMGAGITRSFMDIFRSVSVSFTLICLFAALVNWYLKKKQVSNDIWRGFLLIETGIFGILMAVVLKFAFLPPMICTVLIFIFSLGSYLSIKSKA